MYSIKRTDKEIDDVLEVATRLSDEGKNPYWGQTYAEGVSAALNWVMGNFREPPLADESVALPKTPVARKKHK